jgi:hypothetical protein
VDGVPSRSHDAREGSSLAVSDLEGRVTESWYVLDAGSQCRIGPMTLDELVARTWEGSVTPDTAISEGLVTTRWQAARDVERVGPLLDAVAAGRPSGCHWQRLHRRRTDGTLWRAMFTWKPGPLVIVCAILLWAALAPGPGEGAVLLLLGLVARIATYFISDAVTDRRARIAARTSASGNEDDPAIFVYDLTHTDPRQLEDLDQDQQRLPLTDSAPSSC